MKRAAVSVRDFDEAMERILRIGPVESMKQDEIALGFQPVYPGGVEWLSPNDWHANVVVSVRHPDVRIVAITAIQKGKGAFSRLIDGIVSAGMTPIVVEPMFDMVEIVGRWRWHFDVIGEGFHSETQCRPSKEWIAARITNRTTHNG
jgi:hypothetical protein